MRAFVALSRHRGGNSLRSYRLCSRKSPNVDGVADYTYSKRLILGLLLMFCVAHRAHAANGRFPPIVTGAVSGP